MTLELHNSVVSQLIQSPVQLKGAKALAWVTGVHSQLDWARKLAPAKRGA